MYLVNKDGDFYAAKYRPNLPGCRGVDAWEVNLSVGMLNDHGFYLDGPDIPACYEKLRRPQSGLEAQISDIECVQTWVAFGVLCEKLGFTVTAQGSYFKISAPNDTFTMVRFDDTAALTSFLGNWSRREQEKPNGA